MYIITLGVVGGGGIFTLSMGPMESLEETMRELRRGAKAEAIENRAKRVKNPIILDMTNK